MAENLNAFGSNVCVKGRKHQWTVSIEKDCKEWNPLINIGIIESDKANESLIASWWWNEFGYSYFIDGAIYHGSICEAIN